MILIFGGAYQGKLTYTLERFKLTDADVYKCYSDNSLIPEKVKIIYEIDKWILSLIKDGIDVDNAIQQFVDNNRDAIVICNDISCGIVPLDPILRKWRDAVGRSLAVFSGISDEVIRLFCGIPTRIK